jgi:hypothetical protein
MGGGIKMNEAGEKILLERIKALEWLLDHKTEEVHRLETALKNIIETRGDVPYDPNIHIACKRIAREALE